MITHVPGPWRVIDSGDLGWHILAGHSVIATIPSTAQRGTEDLVQNFANAVLIAASETLYMILRNIRDGVENAESLATGAHASLLETIERGAETSGKRSTHTPEPWYIDHSDDMLCRIISDNDSVIANVGGTAQNSSIDSMFENLANAAVMEGAPAMYRVLCDFRDGTADLEDVTELVEDIDTRVDRTMKGVLDSLKGEET